MSSFGRLAMLLCRKAHCFSFVHRPGNDFSTLYAPLIRDGRMEKYYWNPTREDRIGVCMGIFQHDGVNRQARHQAFVECIDLSCWR